MSNKFCHLHLHTMDSIADSTIKNWELAKRIKELGMDSVAITDHGVLYGVVDFYKACKANKIKPIIGCETYVAPSVNTSKVHGVDDANYHLVLLCETQEGYQNLIKICSDAYLNGFYSKPRTDKHMLRKHSSGLIALSACMGGSIQKYILNGDYARAKDEALLYDDIFGRGNFFLEIQDHGTDEDRIINSALIQLSKETGIPLVATNDCHYVYPDQFTSHDVLMAIQAKKTIYDDKRKKYASDQFYVKSPDEMWRMFGHVPEALENTVKIAERCNVEFSFNENKIPHYDTPDGHNADTYLRYLTQKGAEWRYGEITEQIQERIDFELSVISNMGFSDYFLIVWDFMDWGRNNDVYVGPGRGSAAGSIVCFCLRITEVEPLGYDLLFERFLDPSRISMPDIDIDWDYERRHMAIEYVTDKYGSDCVAQIITKGTMAAKAAINRVGAAYDYKPSVYNSLSKLVPATPGIKLKKAIEMVDDLSAKYETGLEAKKILSTAIELEGLPIYTGTHAAGVLITDDKGVVSHVPVALSKEGMTVTQFDMNILEELGLLKMDFLGLRTLTVCRHAIEQVKENYNTDINIYDIYHYTDLKPLELVRKGFTHGIFQLESAGMTAFMRELQPTKLSEIIDGMSLYRPGPMQYIGQYLHNRATGDRSYIFPELADILESSYGILTYQEQCMKAVVELAGYKKHHSDSFRKAIGKKKEDLIELHMKYFIDGREEIVEDGKVVQDAIPGGVKLGRKREHLIQFYNEMREFGKYAFNKSHAAAYTVVSYVTMYLKYYYPAEYMSALINSFIKSKPRVSRYIQHCKSDLEINVLRPDINKSDVLFRGKDKEIVFGLLARDANISVLMQIVDERNKNGEFKSFEDFMHRTLDFINKSTLMSLTFIGAFDSLNIKRSQIIASIPKLTDKASSVKKARSTHIQKGKEYNLSEKFDVYSFIPPEIQEYTDDIRLRLEKRYSGIYLDGHPLAKHKILADSFCNFELEKMEFSIDEDSGEIITQEGLFDGMNVRFLGVMGPITLLYTKEGNKPMCRCEVEDMTGVSDMVVFNKQYLKCKDEIKEGDIYKITATVQIDDRGTGLIMRNIEPIKEEKIKRLVVDLSDCDDSEIVRVSNLFARQDTQGQVPVYIRTKKFNILLKKMYWIDLDAFLRLGLTKYLPKYNVIEK